MGTFLFSIASRPALGPTESPNQRVPGALSTGVQQQRREADHSPPSSVEVKNAWRYTAIPQYVFMAWCLVKHRDIFNFTFTLSLINWAMRTADSFPLSLVMKGGEYPLPQQLLIAPIEISLEHVKRKGSRGVMAPI
jgi:hypothetical protein